MMKFKLLSLYDASFDIIDLKINEYYQYDYSIEVDSSFIMDISTDKRIVAFEILDVSKYFNVPCKVFYQSEWLIKVKVTEEVIKLKLTLKTKDNEYSQSDKVINKDNVIPGEYVYCRQL